MLGIRIKAAKSVHPEYLAAANRAQRAGETTVGVPKFLHHDVGEIVASADVPGQCLGEDPLFAPHDQECRDAVVALLNSPRRRNDLERLQNMYANRDKLTKGGKEYVEAIFGKHKSEIVKQSPAHAAVMESEPKP